MVVVPDPEERYVLLPEVLLRNEAPLSEEEFRTEAPEALWLLRTVPEDVLLRTAPAAALRDVPEVALRAVPVVALLRTPPAAEERTVLEAEDALRVTPVAELREDRTVVPAAALPRVVVRTEEEVRPAEALRVTVPDAPPRLTEEVMEERPPRPSRPRSRVVTLVP